MARDVTITGAGGEYMDAVTVVEWCVAVGDTVKAGETIAVVETAKAASDIEAPCDGTLAEIMADVGDEIEVGAVLGRIDDGEAASVDPAPDPAPASAPGNGRVVASPLARRIAVQERIDLAQVRGTGPHGRIKRRDVERALRETGRERRSPGAGAEAGLFVEKGPSGDTEPVVLLHGFGADLSVWRGLLGRLDRSVATLGVDLPGHGRSPRLEGLRSLKAMADAVAATLRAEGLAGCHLVGHSLGGAVALALVDARAVEARSLALLAPAGLGPEIDGAFLAGLSRASRLESLTAWVKRLFAEPAAMPEGYADAVMRRREDPELRRYQEALVEVLFPDGTQAFDARPTLDRVTVPVKVIWGDSDRIIPIGQTAGLGGHVALHRLARTGHMPQIEQPELVARLIDELVRSAGGARSASRVTTA